MTCINGVFAKIKRQIQSSIPRDDNMSDFLHDKIVRDRDLTVAAIIKHEYVTINGFRNRFRWSSRKFDRITSTEGSCYCPTLCNSNYSHSSLRSR